MSWRNVPVERVISQPVNRAETVRAITEVDARKTDLDSRKFENYSFPISISSLFSFR